MAQIKLGVEPGRFEVWIGGDSTADLGCEFWLSRRTFFESI